MSAEVSKSIVISNFPESWNESNVNDFISGAGETTKIIVSEGKALVVFVEEESVEGSSMFDGMDNIKVEPATKDSIKKFLPDSDSDSDDDKKSEKSAKSSSSNKSKSSSKSKKSDKSLESPKKVDSDGFDLLIKDHKSPDSDKSEKKKEASVQKEEIPEQKEEIPEPKEEEIQEKEKEIISETVSPVKEMLKDEGIPRDTSYEKITNAAEYDPAITRCDIATGKCYTVFEAEALEKTNFPKGTALPANSPFNVIYSKGFVGKVVGVWLASYALMSIWSCCSQ